MDTNTILKNLKLCSLGQNPKRIPLFPVAMEFGMSAAGITYRENRNDLEKMIDMNCMLVQDYHLDWGLVFPDDYIKWEAELCLPFAQKVIREIKKKGVFIIYHMAMMEETIKCAKSGQLRRSPDTSPPKEYLPH
ncbi:MAG: hypothetical protein ABIG61_11455 [Planctomycetota bacterium]